MSFLLHGTQHLVEGLNSEGTAAGVSLSLAALFIVFSCKRNTAIVIRAVFLQFCMAPGWSHNKHCFMNVAFLEK